MNRRHVVLLGLTSLASLIGFSPLPDPTGAATKARGSEREQTPITVFFVRHAETAGSTRSGGDPTLSESGEGRSRVLARLLGAANVEHFFSSEFARTRGTLVPLAGEAQIQVISAREGAQQLKALRALEAGTVAIVAGHSNTVPALVLGLGGEIDELLQDERHGAMLEHYQYDRLFCVTLDPVSGRALTSVELRYGMPCEAPPPVGAAEGKR